jgi:hypothetical protein
MPDINKLDELWRRSLDLNVRYYGAVGRLTADYFKDLASVLLGKAPSPPSQGGSGTSDAGQVRRAGVAAGPAAQSATTGAMVLEGEAGGRVLGVFMVENHLGQAISAKVVASPFADSGGRTVQPVMTFEPETVTLGPGEQALVRVTTVIDETLEPEARYLGQLTIPGLAGTKIPVVLRRRAAQADESEPAVDDVATGKPSRRRRGAVSGSPESELSEG